jgi:hypothetical protein
MCDFLFFNFRHFSPTCHEPLRSKAAFYVTAIAEVVTWVPRQKALAGRSLVLGKRGKYRETQTLSQAFAMQLSPLLSPHKSDRALPLSEILSISVSSITVVNATDV